MSPKVNVWRRDVACCSDFLCSPVSEKRLASDEIMEVRKQ